jgi:RNA polymerase sigma-70 factor (ECF subfamily)
MAPRASNSPSDTPPGSPSDDALVASLRAGDETAYEKLITTHGGPMLAAIRRILPNAEDAQDALQDAFLSAFKAVERFEAQSKLSTWLHRIAVNAALMRLRKLKRSKEQSVESLQPRFTDGGHHLEPSAPWSDSGEASAQRAETRQIVQDAIAGLPETHRNALLLRDIQGLSNEDVARELGVTVNAAKIRVHRARLALRGVLDTHLRPESQALPSRSEGEA